MNQAFGPEPVVYCLDTVNQDLPLFPIVHFSGLLDPPATNVPAKGDPRWWL